MSLSRPVILLLACFGTPVAAGGYADSLSGASIEFESVDFEVEVGGAPATFEMERVGVTLVERQHERLALGLRGGYLSLSSNDDPALAGVDPEGGFLGVTVVGTLWQHGSLRLLAQGDYLYAHSRKDSPAQKTTLKWTEGSLRAALSWRLGPVELVGGVHRSMLRGDEVLSGGLVVTRDFELASESGSFLGLDLAVEETGRIGVRLESGAREGIALVFARDY